MDLSESRVYFPVPESGGTLSNSPHTDFLTWITECPAPYHPALILFSVSSELFFRVLLRTVWIPFFSPLIFTYILWDLVNLLGENILFLMLIKRTLSSVKRSSPFLVLKQNPGRGGALDSFPKVPHSKGRRDKNTICPCLLHKIPWSQSILVVSFSLPRVSRRDDSSPGWCLAAGAPHSVHTLQEATESARASISPCKCAINEHH